MGGGQSTNVLSNDLNRFKSTCVVGSTQLDIENMSFTTRIQDKVAGKERKASRIKWEQKVSLGNTTQYISGERTGKALGNALRKDLYNASKYRSCDLLELTCLNSTKKTTLFILLLVHVRGDLGGDTHEEGEEWRRTQLNNNKPTTLWRNSQITMQRPGNLATQMQENFTSISQQGQRRITDEHLVQTTQRLIKKRIKMSLNNSKKINRLSPHIHTINLKSDGCPLFSFDGYCLPQDTSSFSFSLALNFKSYFSLGLRKLMSPSMTLLDKKTNELPNHISVNDPMIINTKHSNTPCLINLYFNSKEAKCSSAKDVRIDTDLNLSKASFIDVSNFCTENFGLL